MSHTKNPPKVTGDFDEAKEFGSKVYPVQANITSSLLRRCEPLLTPDKLTKRYLKGIDLSDYSSDDLKDKIELAMNDFELETNLSVTHVQRIERVPFDRQAYKSFVYFKLEHGPILSLEALSIQSSNGENIYKLPASWIEMGFAHKRQINLIPILSIFGAAGLKDGQASNAGLIFLQAVNNFRWMPAFFTVKYTTGLSHKDGHVPLIVNEIIGIIAALDILSMEAAKNKYTSSSIGQDGISQSSANPGPQVYKVRTEELQLKKKKQMDKLKSIFHQKYFMTNI